MTRVVGLPPEKGIRPDGNYAGGWWHEADEPDRVVCDLCPRHCQLRPSDRGFCFVRENIAGEMLLTTYGRSTGFCIDPIEKKPLNHFFPGTSVLSFGTAGCNLGCKFCQNWDISKSRQVERLSEEASPAAVAEAARHYGCRSVAYTYNDPVVWAEYAIDTAKECRALGIRNVAVTAGYISPAARGPFYEYMDAANVDLKAFTEEFYHRLTSSHLQPVLDTLAWLKQETSVWLEITNLVIPTANDSLDEIRQMCDWILEHVGDEVPLHFSAFHPDFRLRDLPPTQHETLLAAHAAAVRQGLKYVYTGNVDDAVHQSTYCPRCKGLLIERNWYDLGVYHLRGNQCGHCNQTIAGVYDDRPGDWGRKRLPVRISQFASPLPVAVTPTSRDALQDQPTAASHEKQNAMTSVTPSPASPQNSDARRPELSAQQEQAIHAAACEAVAAAILRRPFSLPDVTLGGAAGITVMGAFVTLKRRGRLRACCGVLGRPMPLAAAVQQASLRTATEDARLPPISPTELLHLEVDVSLLHGFATIQAAGKDRVAAVEVGRHGLQIHRGSSAGLLLPSVASEQGYDAQEFLRQVCRKAGLPTTAWEDEGTTLQTFEAQMVSAPFAATAVGETARPARVVSDEELRILLAHCGSNLAALFQGATPSYYVPGCTDGTVHGVAITMKPAGGGEATHCFRLGVRPGMPLQSTLFNLTEAALDAVRSGRLRLSPGNVQLGLSILYDPAMHGTLAEPDLRGIDSRERAVLVSEGAKSAWAYDPGKTPQQLLDEAAHAVRVFQPETASVLSLAIQSTEPALLVSNAPRPGAGPAVRPAAVAGTFYPAEAAALAKTVDDCLQNGHVQVETWPAIMVPHAGLIYSGRIAAQVFRQVRIPDRVIVIGPKHTRLGMEWAVAPHEQWSIPGASVASDPELARRLAEAIPGLELDAAAHQQEHAIEVQLPFLARLAPQAKVVGITIGGGHWAKCREFAAGLAQVVGAMESRPLLVVSTDMHHYAAESENRRLDQIALEAIERLDPGEVYQTVVHHGISMCGVLPAVIIMQAIRDLGGLKECRRVAYGTSGEVSHDMSRVVGYAGMLFR